jgi:Mycolic acid cyclopropane synthetase
MSARCIPFCTKSVRNTVTIPLFLSSFFFFFSFCQQSLSVVFPGSHVSSYPHLTAAMNTASEGRFVTDSVTNIGPHYARTIRDWKRKFIRNFDYTIAPLLKDECRMDLVEIAWFKRKWICTLSILLFPFLCFAKKKKKNLSDFFFISLLSDFL